jgi:N-acetylmuramoyl-L-alanine amidase
VVVFAHEEEFGMIFKRPTTLVSATALGLVATGIMLAPTVSSAANVSLPVLSYDMTVAASAETPQPVTPPAGDLAQSGAAPAPDADAAQPSDPVDTASVECMAKVVLHEAANQPREGKIAVAQTLMNRLHNGRFGGSICEVVNQRGQFFHIASFQPRRGTDGWQDAVEVAHEVLAGEAKPVAPGAMFFRASYAPASAFFRSRQRVATVGAQIFYR